MENKIELDSLEKTSTLVRNVVLIIGALVTVAFYLSDRISTDVTVHVKTLYLNGDNTIISSPPANDNDGSILSGRLGTISEVTVTNNTKLPVSLEVRVPKIQHENDNANWPHFTTISAEPYCHLKEKEILISNNGLVQKNTVGSVAIERFPPDCTLEVTVASTQLDEQVRFMSGKIEVFYDGKKAEIETPTHVYGLFGDYLYLVSSRGFIGILLFVLMPILLFIFGIVWIMETLPKKTPPKDA